MRKGNLKSNSPVTFWNQISNYQLTYWYPPLLLQLSMSKPLQGVSDYRRFIHIYTVIYIGQTISSTVRRDIVLILFASPINKHMCLKKTVILTLDSTINFSHPGSSNCYRMKFLVKKLKQFSSISPLFMEIILWEYIGALEFSDKKLGILINPTSIEHILIGQDNGNKEII